jgi:thiosulfate dehydrogenase
MALNLHMGTVIVAAVTAFATPASAYDPDTTGNGLQSSIARGGRLYDNWYVEIKERAPAVSHPAYPRDRAHFEDPKTNWRCKECHGWDYRGRDGAYGKGRHFTGIKGIRDMAGADPATIISILRGENHRYGGVMAEADLRDLSNFVSRGQVDMDRYVDRKTRMAKGHETLRQDYYKSICIGCHGRDGHKLRTIPPLGDVTRDNPWESLHKILNGHPGERMPALRVLDRQTLVDVLAYVQTLPDGMPRDMRVSLIPFKRAFQIYRSVMRSHAGMVD